MSSVHALVNDSFKSILILSFYLSLRTASGYFLLVPPPKPCVHHFSPSYVPHTRMLSFFLIRSHGVISGEDIRPIELYSRYILTALVFGECVENNRFYNSDNNLPDRHSFLLLANYYTCSTWC